MVLRGGKVLSVFTGEWLDADVAIRDGHVVGLGRYDGVVYAMSGASERHNLLVTGLVSGLRARLPSHCRVYPSDMRVRIHKPTRFFYPDVTVVCGSARITLPNAFTFFVPRRRAAG